MAPPPLCFVLMPFGRKIDAAGRTIDFDAVYHEMIAPAVERGRARADARGRGKGRRHHPQADVRAADALRLRGGRHHRRQSQRVLRARHPPAMRPRTTVILFAEGTTLPFDIALLRGISIPNRRNGRADRAEIVRQPVLVTPARRRRGQNPHDDSPLFQLLDYMPRFEVDHVKTDVFRERFDYSKRYKAAARRRARAGRRGGARAVAG